jgi:large subunit ribosomal protein L30
MPSLELKLVKSRSKRTATQLATLDGLGLRRIQKTVVREDTPAIRGAVKKVLHLVEVRELA